RARIRGHAGGPLYLVLRRAPSSTLFPYTTLFRSRQDCRPPDGARCRARRPRAAPCPPPIRLAAGGPCECARLQGAGLRQTERTRSEEHTSELQSRENLVCRLLLEKKKRPSRNEPV